MNQSLAEFLDKAQLPGVMGFIAALARALLSNGDNYNVSSWRKLSIVIGSVAMAILAAYLSDEHDATRKYTQLIALATGFCAQDICMRLTKRANAVLDVVSERADDAIKKFSQTREKSPRNQHHDD